MYRYLCTIIPIVIHGDRECGGIYVCKMIIGISGYSGAGKDTSADMLHSMIPYSSRVSMASPLKDIVSILFGWDRDMLEGVTAESREMRMRPDSRWQHLAGHGIFHNDQHITPLIALKRIGTDLFRNGVHNDIWCMILKERLRSSSSRAVIISDARFPNELDMCDITIKVTRASNSTCMDISEIAHLGYAFDITITNNGTIGDLEHKIRNDVLPVIMSRMV